MLKENGAWVWAVNHPGSIKFSYPDGVKLVFINDSPVSINEKSKYIQCHGCLMYMTYVIDEPEYVLEIEWVAVLVFVTIAGISSAIIVGRKYFSRP